MKKVIIFAMALCCHLPMNAQRFDDYFEDKTLRIDYIFNGNAERQEISLDGLVSLPGWAGRRSRLAELPLEGNGQIIVRDSLSQQVIYKTSFSTLFQEWMELDEPSKVTKGFENTFLVPYPKKAVEVEVVLFGLDRQVKARMKHMVNPIF